MTIGIAASEQQRAELIIKGVPTFTNVSWVGSTNELLNTNADVLIDCTFCDPQLPGTSRPFLFHSPVNTLTSLQATGMAGRFCAWNTFLKRQLWDIAITDANDGTWVNRLADELGWKFCIVQDEPGLIAPRMVCNIINEARHVFRAGISSQREIDLAMKLGTNYPYGPFEWEDKIGADNINTLLTKLEGQQSFYSRLL